MKELIGVIGGKSGDAITYELKKIDKKVLLIVGKENEPGVNDADIVLVKNLSEKEYIYKFLISHNVKKVIIATGHILAIELAEFLKERNISVSIDIDFTKLCKDKYIFKEFIKDKGFKTPSHKYIKYNENNREHIDSIIEETELPCVLKSTIDKTQPQLIHNKIDMKNEIEKILSLNSDLIIEEYINGNDCTVAICSDGNEIINLGITYWSKAKENNLKGFKNAYSIKMSEEIENEIISIANKLAIAIGVLGLCRVDFIVQNEEIYILEVNSVVVCGYTGTLYPFFKEQNINLAEMAVQTALKIMK